MELGMMTQINDEVTQPNTFFYLTHKTDQGFLSSSKSYYQHHNIINYYYKDVCCWKQYIYINILS